MNTFLLDSHVLLWAVAEPSRLSAVVVAHLTDEANELLVSAASAWEIATKFRIGKLPNARPLLDQWDDALKRLRATPLAIDSTHARRAGMYQAEHRDPFDRLLAAQAELVGCPLLTIDKAFADFPIAAIW
jgi:PIN domain nuclease of toxin-antitoxin system